MEGGGNRGREEGRRVKGGGWREREGRRDECCGGKVRRRGRKSKVKDIRGWNKATRR